MTGSGTRSLGPWRTWALVAGGAIGSAVFMMPAIVVPYGGLGLVSLAAAGIGALFVALTLVLIGTVGLWFVDRETLPPLNPGSGSALHLFASAFALTFWNYVGIEAATLPAEDVQDPERTVPRALVFGTLTVMAVYLLVAFAVMGIIPAAELAESEAPLAAAGARRPCPTSSSACWYR